MNGGITPNERFLYTDLCLRYSVQFFNHLWLDFNDLHGVLWPKAEMVTLGMTSCVLVRIFFHRLKKKFIVTSFLFLTSCKSKISVSGLNYGYSDRKMPSLVHPKNWLNDSTSWYTRLLHSGLRVGFSWPQGSHNMAGSRSSYQIAKDDSFYQFSHCIYQGRDLEFI